MNDAEAHKIIARLEEIGATNSAQRILDQDAEIARLSADNERLRAALERAESNFYNAANALDDYDYRGPVPGLNGPVVAHRAEFHAAMVEQLDGYAKQCFAALTASAEAPQGRISSAVPGGDE